MVQGVVVCSRNGERTRDLDPTGGPGAEWGTHLGKACGEAGAPPSVVKQPPSGGLTSHPLQVFA